jgi:hypothetical protein
MHMGREAGGLVPLLLVVCGVPEEEEGTERARGVSTAIRSVHDGADGPTRRQRMARIQEVYDARPLHGACGLSLSMEAL